MRRASLVAVVLLGCGGPGSATNPDGNHGDDDVDAPPDTPPGFTELIGRDWGPIPPGTADDYECRKIQIDHEMWISSFKAQSPTGTHHEIVTVSNDATGLGDSLCSAGILDPKMLYAGGIDTDEFTLPDGVAVHVQAGQYLSLNVHLFNATDNMLSGHSAVLVKTIDASQVVHEADMTFAGTTNINNVGTGNSPPFAPNTPGIPGSYAGSPVFKANGGCAIPAGDDWNVIAMWPHMHGTGTHVKLAVNTTVSTTLLDTDYSFTEQKNYMMPPTTVLHPGNQVVVTCSYVNTTSKPIPYGDGSNAEMCYVGLYRWPIIEPSDPYQCVSN